MLLATIGAAAIAQDEIEALVDRLVERGEIAEKDGKKLVREVMDKRKGKATKVEEEISKHIRERAGSHEHPLESRCRSAQPENHCFIEEDRRFEETLSRSGSRPSMVVIKRYPNRKLYDTIAKQYITLDGVAELVRQGSEIKVVDHASGEDLTAFTLTQIILEQEKKRMGYLRILS